MKILIVKIAAIGDVIMALSMLTAIQETYPNAHITWICGRNVAPLLKEFSVDEIIEVDENRLLAGNFLEKLGAVFSVWSHICFKHYNLGVIAHGDKRYRLLTFLTFFTHRTGFGSINGRACPIPGRYHVDEYARLIKGVDDYKMYSAELPMLKVLAESSIQTRKEKKIVALAPGGAKNIMRDDGCRRWPINDYVQLARMLLKNGYEVVLTGANSDKWIEPYFKDLPIKNCVGKTNLLELATLFKKSLCLVTHDSGPMHIAILARAKVIALFGPTNHREKVRSNSFTKVICNTANLPCCPCYDGKGYAFCDNNICMTGISVKIVFSEIQKLADF